MNFTMKTPCDQCPFLKVGGIRLDRGRARAIGSMMADSHGGTFPCHKTTAFDDEGEHVARPEEVHCAGALIFAEKQENATQMMRISERIGMYDAAALMANKEAVDSVFDSVEQMVEANTEMRMPPKRVKETLAVFGRKAKRKKGVGK